ncbi:MAG: helix-turn-helix transcriptional regulator [Spirochaetaceae bacterium]|jgi:transcriptional regulator with XRE-family HTH domain|nr:helix-turn-helix transcriptional regulator [Spirochaetaceae bacterium]
MERLGEILAKNMKKHRRKCGISQAQLAEKVNVSTHHIGMIELARNFPTLDLVERIANALDIEIYQLFVEPHSPNEELEQLRQEIKDDMKQLLNEFLEKAIHGICTD